MHALSYLSSKAADDLAKGMARLQQASHETWSVDWERFALVCGHGVVMAHRAALDIPANALQGYVARKHTPSEAKLFQPSKSRRL